MAYRQSEESSGWVCGVWWLTGSLSLEELLRRPGKVVGARSDFRQADLVERAFLAGRLENSQGDHARFHQSAQLSDRPLRQLPQRLGEFYFSPSFARGVKNGSAKHRPAKH